MTHLDTMDRIIWALLRPSLIKGARECKRGGIIREDWLRAARHSEDANFYRYMREVADIVWGEEKQNG